MNQLETVSKNCLEYKDYIDVNPFNKIQIKFREPAALPKIIPLHTVETFLLTMYHQYQTGKTAYQKRNCLRDIAVVEVLYQPACVFLNYVP